MTGLSRLSERRLSKCLDFSLKCRKDVHNARFFPLNPNLGNTLETRGREQFKVNFCRTKKYHDSAVPFCQRLLNKHWREKEEGMRAEGQGAGGQGGVGQGAGGQGVGGQGAGG